MICKQPSIYKNGLSPEEVSEIVQDSEWLNVSSKIGTVLAPSPSNVSLFYNKTLSLIYSRGFFVFSSNQTGITPCYQFNNDLPGIDVTTGPAALFYYDPICYISNYKCGLLRIFPYDYPDNRLNRKITVDGYDFREVNFSGMFRFNSSYTDEFQNYLDTH